MKMSWITRLLMYGIFVISIVVSGFYLGAPGSVEATTCCTYGVDCPTQEPPAPEMLCCYPMSGQADCHPSNPNYCKSACS